MMRADANMMHLPGRRAIPSLAHRSWPIAMIVAAICNARIRIGPARSDDDVLAFTISRVADDDLLSADVVSTIGLNAAASQIRSKRRQRDARPPMYAPWTAHGE